MGSFDLTPPSPDIVGALLAQLPTAADETLCHAILRELVARVATVLEVPTPTRFDTAVDAATAMRGDQARARAAIAAIPDTACTPDLLGIAYEHLMTTPDRRERGAHFTPIAVAEVVVGLAIDRLDLGPMSGSVQIWDPAAGGGAFLLAAARRIARDTDVSRSEIVARLHATDIDPLALEVCAASLELWCRGGATPVTHCGDTLLDLPDDWPSTFDLIVGNPPFLGQLSADTTRTGARRERLLDAFDTIARGYVDESGLFLHLSLSRMAPRGVVSLVLPESILATRDAQPLRAAADRAGFFAVLWIDDGQSFAASVDVVACVFTATEPVEPQTVVIIGEQPPTLAPRPQDGVWASLLAGARGVPMVQPPEGGRTVGDLAAVTAGFRQHFYGLEGAVREATASEKSAVGSAQPPGRSTPLLVTSGAIDPLWLRWGLRRAKFAGRTWEAPVVDLAGIDDPAVRTWFEDRRVPKVLVASQTKVLEVVGDPFGALLPSVPSLSVEPFITTNVWRLAAVLASPWASAWLAGRSAGSGLSTTAVRVRARDLAELPLPTDASAWQEGAHWAERAQRAASQGDTVERAKSLHGLGAVMTEAYGDLNSSVNEWWWERLGSPEGSFDTAY